MDPPLSLSLYSALTHVNILTDFTISIIWIHLKSNIQIESLNFHLLLLSISSLSISSWINWWEPAKIDDNRERDLNPRPPDIIHDELDHGTTVFAPYIFGIGEPKHLPPMTPRDIPPPLMRPGHAEFSSCNQVKNNQEKSTISYLGDDRTLCTFTAFKNKGKKIIEKKKSSFRNWHKITKPVLVIR